MMKRIHRLISFMLVIFCVLSLMPIDAFAASNYSEEYRNSDYYRNLKNVSLSGNGKEDMIAIALSQVGYHEGDDNTKLGGDGSANNNYTEYGRWANCQGQAWCAAFMSWCANEAGILNSALSHMTGVPYDAYVYSRSYSSSGHGIYHSVTESFTGSSGIIYPERESPAYIPQKGDLFVTNGHVGLCVSDYANGRIEIVNGNKEDCVCTGYLTGDKNGNYYQERAKIVGFLTPDYSDSSARVNTPFLASTTSAVRLSLSELQAKYPDGKYWNHVGMSGNNADGWTNTPCPSHNDTSTCNSFATDGDSNFGWQCFGFACKLGYDAYGSYPYKWGRAYNLDNIKAGDIINYNGNGHTVFVTNVSGNSVTIAECNYGGRCLIRWGRTLQKSQFTNLLNVYVAPYELGGSTEQNKYESLGFTWASAFPIQSTGNVGAAPTMNATDVANKVSWFEASVTTLTAPNITAILDGDWCIVKYYHDDRGEYVERYTKLSYFIRNINYTPWVANSLKASALYAREDLSTAIDTPPAGAEFIIVSESSNGSYYQAFWHCSTGYWLGWIAKNAFVKEYTVSYNANGGSGAPSSQTKTHGTALTLSSTKPTRTGYTFQGWATSSTATTAAYSAGGSYTADAAATLYAVWKANTYSVKYNANGGSGSMSSSTHTYGTAKALTANAFTKTGYTFQGWSTSSSATTATYTDKQSVSNLTSTSGGTVNLYAVWKANTYSVKYNANGGSGSMSSSTHTYGTAKALTANAFTKTGYTFQGWSTSSSATTATYTDKQSVSNLTSTSGGTVNLYAVWEKNHTHAYSKQVISDTYLANAATCTEAAKYYYSCECGEKGTAIFTSGNALGHTGGTADCAHKAVCTRCGSEYGELNAANHAGGTEVRNQKAATCTQAGNTGDTCCKGCGAVLTKGTTIKALGHNFADGTCTRCGAADPDFNPTAAKIKVDTVRGTAGKTVKVTVKAENNPGIVSMTLKVEYDPAVLTLVGVTDKGLIPNSMHTTKYTSPYKLTWENDTATSNFTASGVLVELEFRIAENTEQGEYPIVVSTVKDGIYNVDADDVAFSMVNGAVVVSSVLPGDVNGDGEVTNKDRLLLSRYLANWEGYDESSIDMLAADVNCDGEVTNKDRLILSRYLANWAGYETLPMT